MTTDTPMMAPHMLSTQMLIAKMLIAKMLIDGQLVSGGVTAPIINPATGVTVADVPQASLAQLDEAVTAARRAAPGWAADRQERGAVLEGLDLWRSQHTAPKRNELTRQPLRRRLQKRWTAHTHQHGRRVEGGLVEGSALVQKDRVHVLQVRREAADLLALLARPAAHGQNERTTRAGTSASQMQQSRRTWRPCSYILSR